MKFLRKHTEMTNSAVSQRRPLADGKAWVTSEPPFTDQNGTCVVSSTDVSERGLADHTETHLVKYV